MRDFSAMDASPELEMIIASLRAHFSAAGRVGCCIPVGRGLDEGKLGELAVRHTGSPPSSMTKCKSQEVGRFSPA